MTFNCVQKREVLSLLPLLICGAASALLFFLAGRKPPKRKLLLDTLGSCAALPPLLAAIARIPHIRNAWEVLCLVVGFALFLLFLTAGKVRPSRQWILCLLTDVAAIPLLLAVMADREANGHGLISIMLLTITTAALVKALNGRAGSSRPWLYPAVLLSAVPLAAAIFLQAMDLFA